MGRTEYSLLFFFTVVARKSLEFLLGVILSLASRHGGIIVSMEGSASKLGPSGKYIVWGGRRWEKKGGRQEEGVSALLRGDPIKVREESGSYRSLGRGEPRERGCIS